MEKQKRLIVNKLVKRPKLAIFPINYQLLTNIEISSYINCYFILQVSMFQ